MDVESEHDVPEPMTQQEQLFERLQPESEQEERLVRQIALCSVKLEHIEAVLTRAQQQLQSLLEAPAESP